MYLLVNPCPDHPVLNDISGHARFVVQQQKMWLVPGILSWLSIQTKQAATSLPPLNQVKPGAFGKDTVSSISCSLAWYLPSSFPGFFTSTSQAEPWRAHTCYLWFLNPALGPSLEYADERGCLAEEFHFLCGSHISVRLCLFNHAWHAPCITVSFTRVHCTMVWKLQHRMWEIGYLWDLVYLAHSRLMFFLKLCLSVWMA